MNAYLREMQQRNARRLAWRAMTEPERIDTIIRQLMRTEWRTAAEVGQRLSISEGMARRYLRMAGADGRVEAQPELNFRSTGAAKRLFRLAPKKRGTT